MKRDARHTTEEWRAVAREDPLYAVAAWPGKEAGGWTHEDFYALGRSDWADFHTAWASYRPDLGGVVVDLGCGAGRITHAMASDFERVIAVDVSPEMAELARAACPENVEIHVVEGIEIPVEPVSVDAVFTSHVLQHLENRAAVRRALGEAARVLRPGGTLMAHVLHSEQRPPYRARLRSELALRRARRARARGETDWTLRVRTYTEQEVRTLLDEVGLVDVDRRSIVVRSNRDPHPFWLARRA